MQMRAEKCHHRMWIICRARAIVPLDMVERKHGLLADFVVASPSDALNYASFINAGEVVPHRNVAEREGIAAGMAAFLLHQHASLRVPAALIHQPQHISARLPTWMRDDRGSTTPRDRDRVRVDASQFGESPVLHLDDEYADLRKDRIRSG